MIQACGDDIQQSPSLACKASEQSRLLHREVAPAAEAGLVSWPPSSLARCAGTLLQGRSLWIWGGENPCDTPVWVTQELLLLSASSGCCHRSRAAPEQAAWGLPGCSLLQLGAAPRLCLHHHLALGAFLILLASCLPQHRVQDVWFHLQISFKLLPALL